MNKIIILGGNGNLGTQLSQIIPNSISWDRNDFDATNTEFLKSKLTAELPIKAIINCIAFNDLDAAETNPELAKKLNADFVLELAIIAKSLNAPLVHYSTGYVFHGENQIEHAENDKPNPKSAYAESKLAGEEHIQNIGGQYYIIRTNVLFGPQGTSSNAKPSVIDVMKKIGVEKRLLRGITDELSNFTYTPDLAQATAALLENPPNPGIYHLTNDGYGSWYDLSKEIFINLGYNILDQDPGADLPDKTIVIEKITGDQYPRAAKRPTSAVITNNKLPKLRSWKEALNQYLNRKAQ